MAEDGQLPSVMYEGPVNRKAVRVQPTAEELAAHAAFVAGLKEPVWEL